MQGGGSEVETAAPRGREVVIVNRTSFKEPNKQTINKSELKKKKSVSITAKFPEQLKVDVYAAK